MSEQGRETLARNPLRVLDSKRARGRRADRRRAGDRRVLRRRDGRALRGGQGGLDALGIPYTIAPGLVRGLDYYVRTTFEFAGGTLDSAQNALGGGGRYDGLIEALGGPPTPAIGFALGVDRTLLACDDEGVFAAPEQAVDVFVVDTTGGAEALAITEELRARRRPRRSRVRQQQHEVADEGGRPQRRRIRRHRRRIRA